MKALVTGANGFLGSNLTQKLVQEGYEVSVLVRNPKDFEFLNSQNHLNRNSGNSEPSKVKVFKGDVTQKDSLYAAVKEQEVIFHLAGVVGYSKQQKEILNKVNVIGTENIFNVASELGVRRILVSSSVVAVGASFKPEVLNEDSPFTLERYQLSYHESKRKMESVVKRFVNENKIEGVIVNPSTVYGAGDAAKSTRNTQVNVARGKSLFYPPGGVSVAGVEDVVDGIVKAMVRGRSGERYILAGENITLREVFNLIAIEAGVKKPLIPLPSFLFHLLAFVDDSLAKVGLHGPLASERALVAMMYHWYDSSKAIKELDYRIRPAQESIAKSVRWMKDHQLI